MKFTTKTICLLIAGACLLFWILCFVIDELSYLATDNLGWFFVPPVLAVAFAVAGFALGKQGSKQDNSTNAGNNDVTQKLKQAKELLDSGVISQEQYQAFVDNIINGLK